MFYWGIHSFLEYWFFCVIIVLAVNTSRRSLFQSAVCILHAHCGPRTSRFTMVTSKSPRARRCPNASTNGLNPVEPYRTHFAFLHHRLAGSLSSGVLIILPLSMIAFLWRNLDSSRVLRSCVSYNVHMRSNMRLNSQWVAQCPQPGKGDPGGPRAYDSSNSVAPQQSTVQQNHRTWLFAQFVCVNVICVHAGGCMIIAWRLRYAVPLYPESASQKFRFSSG